MRNYLARRIPSQSRPYADDVTGGKVRKWGEFWSDNENDVKNQMTAILIRELETGMSSKEYENGFREGLSALSKLWSECTQQHRLNARQAETDKIKKERLAKGKIL